MVEEESDSPDKAASASIAMGVAIGTSLGVSLGLALNNLGLGIAIGLSIGVGIGMTRLFAESGAVDGVDPAAEQEAD